MDLLVSKFGWRSSSHSKVLLELDRGVGVGTHGYFT